MSTVALNGYIYYGPNLSTLFAEIGRLKPQAEEACRGSMAQQYARLATRILDRQALGLSADRHDYKKPLASVSRKADESREDKLSVHRRDVNNDWECTITVLLRHGGSPLLRLFAEKSEIYAPLLENIIGIERYFYDDRSDRPDNISKKEWERRSLSWNRAYDPEVLITGSPIIIRLVEEAGILPSRDMYEEAQPEFDQRLAYFACQIAEKRYFADQKLEDMVDIGEIIAASGRWLAYKETEAGQSAIAAVAAEIASKLKPRFTLVDLLGWDPSAPKKEPSTSQKLFM